ncbi:hypothetical protein CK203_074317 [Vitis vinifera]|uniref:Retrotransposon Copia-like N-terminal domain-containing protein n=1 Tax=Vitis vinifera TaxID=29760 RepID=A0A438BYU8_VITVI|nr:hypothetical protein CK203_074317 [Vitis vinifera]
METPPTGVEKHEGENSILADLTPRMTQVLNHNQTQNQITNHEPATHIGIKVDGTNYALWSQIVEMYISGKDKLEYINGDLPQPLQTDLAFRKWRTENAVIQPFPTVEEAYAQVQREDLRQSVMMMNEDTISGGAMLSRKGHKPQHQLSFQTPSNGKPNTATKPKSQGEGGGCTHYGNTKHTKETCFKLHGYPDWWHELKAKKKCEASGGDNPGRAALMSVEPQLSLVPQQESSISTGEQIAQNDSVTEELNCCALMYPNFCLFRDILTNEIIGRGTKREGLYYTDDFSYG